MNKTARHDAIRERAAEAIRNLYHNATIPYFRFNDGEAKKFDDWLSGAVESEIDYVCAGGAYGGNYRKCLTANAANRFKSEAARDYYVRKGLRQMRDERARCNSLDSRSGEIINAAWERITQYGKLYQYGRGGRTLAPEQLVRTGGGSSFRMREDIPAEYNIADCVELISIVESFNLYVKATCESFGEQFREYYKEEFESEDAEAKR